MAINMKGLPGYLIPYIFVMTFVPAFWGLAGWSSYLMYVMNTSYHYEGEIYAAPQETTELVEEFIHTYQVGGTPPSHVQPRISEDGQPGFTYSFYSHEPDTSGLNLERTQGFEMGSLFMLLPLLLALMLGGAMFCAMTGIWKEDETQNA